MKLWSLDQETKSKTKAVSLGTRLLEDVPRRGEKKQTKKLRAAGEVAQ